MHIQSFSFFWPFGVHQNKIVLKLKDLILFAKAGFY